MGSVKKGWKIWRVLNDNIFANESHLFTKGKTTVKTNTRMAREPSIYITSSPLPVFNQSCSSCLDLS